jgi:hypothetical protein
MVEIEIITDFWTGNLKSRNMEQREKLPLKTLKAYLPGKIRASATGCISKTAFPLSRRRASRLDL